MNFKQTINWLKILNIGVDCKILKTIKKLWTYYILENGFPFYKENFAF